MEKILNSLQKKYLDSFRQPADPLISEMEKFADENRVPILSSDSVELLEVLIKIISPRRVLEIGTAIAYSSIRIARLLKKKGVVHTIEKSQDNIIKANEFINRAGLNEKIKIFSGNAENVIPELEKKYNLIFLDADKEDYQKLFDLSIPLLKKRGIIFVDNLLWHGYAAADKIPAEYKTSTEQIRMFNKKFMQREDLRTIILPVGDGIGIGIKE